MCLWSPCESRRAFAWPAELQRHYNDKHVHTKVYRCTALVHSKLCGKEYYRTDKFRNHIVTDHPVETEFFCPIDLCEAGPYTSDLLRVHVTEHGEADYKSYKKCSTWCRLFKEYGSICPVEDCGTKTSFVISHLLSHDLNTRYINREAIRGAGYCEVSLRPLCPICRFSIEDKWGEFYVEETGRNVFLRGATLHMYRSHWHEPENLHKHRRDILKIDPAFDWHGFIKDKVFKDILATVSTQE